MKSWKDWTGWTLEKIRELYEAGDEDGLRQEFSRIITGSPRGPKWAAGDLISNVFWKAGLMDICDIMASCGEAKKYLAEAACSMSASAATTILERLGIDDERFRKNALEAVKSNLKLSWISEERELKQLKECFRLVEKYELPIDDETISKVVKNIFYSITMLPFPDNELSVSLREVLGGLGFEVVVNEEEQRLGSRQVFCVNSSRAG